MELDPGNKNRTRQASHAPCLQNVFFNCPYHSTIAVSEVAGYKARTSNAFVVMQVLSGPVWSGPTVVLGHLLLTPECSFLGQPHAGC